MKTKKIRKQRRRRQHLFSPHTGLCQYCGVSDEDAAIANEPCIKTGGK